MLSLPLAAALFLLTPAPEPAPDLRECRTARPTEVTPSLPESDVRRDPLIHQNLRFTPHYGPDDVFDGYRVSGIRRKSYWYRLHLRNGDVIRAVNGQPFEHVPQVDALAEKEGTGTITISRRGEVRTLDAAEQLRHRPSGGPCG